MIALVQKREEYAFESEVCWLRCHRW
jgi:hypothetical protein